MKCLNVSQNICINIKSKKTQNKHVLISYPVDFYTTNFNLKHNGKSRDKFSNTLKTKTRFPNIISYEEALTVTILRP